MQRKFSLAAKGAYTAEFTAQTQHNLDDIWGALVKPDKLAKWLLPATGKLAKGGQYHLGDVAKGQITVCEPKRRLSLSFDRNGRVQLLDITFGETGKGKAKSRSITLKITAHSADLPAAAWKSMGPAVVAIGWEMVCTALLAYLDAPKTPPAKNAVLLLSASAAGAEYAKSACEEWSKAAQRGGLEMPSSPNPEPQLLWFYTGLHR